MYFSRKESYSVNSGYVLIPLILLIFLSQAVAGKVIFFAAPAVSNVYILGAMKENLTLEVFYDYSDPDSDPEGATIYQWYTYDDNFGTNKTAIPGATGKTFTLTAAEIGKHISVEVTPVDTNLETGATVEYTPWGVGDPNPVLADGSSCYIAGGVGSPPIPGNWILNTTDPELCSPRYIEWEIRYIGIDYSSTNMPVIYVDWEDGTVENYDAVLMNPDECNMSKQEWVIIATHTFDYDNGSAPPADGSCTYLMTTYFGLKDSSSGAITSICRTQDQTQEFTVWDDIGNPDIGDHNIDHDPTSTGNEVGETVEICEHDTDPVRMLDNSTFNCVPPIEDDTYNDKSRWTQWVYGTNSTITYAPGDKITINGVQYEATDLPIYGPPQWLDGRAGGVFNPVPPNTVTYDIQMPVSAGVGERFEVTLRTWNTCNPYDVNLFDGDGLNPFAGSPVFDVFGDGSVMANSNPEEVTFDIVIVDAPPPPNDPSMVICNGDDPTMTATTSMGGGAQIFTWYSDINLTNVIFVGATFDPSSDHLNPADNIDPTVAGTYIFYVTETRVSVTNPALDCESLPREVNLVIREDLILTDVITGPANVCRGDMNITYSLPNNPPVYPVGGATEYTWSIPSGWTLVSQDSRSITLNAPMTPGTGSVSVTLDWADGTPSCPTTPVNLDVTVNPAPVVTPGLNQTICSGDVTNLVLTFDNYAPGEATFFWNALPVMTGGMTGGSTRPDPGNENAITDSFINPSGANQTATYSVTGVSTAAGCYGNPEDVIITVVPPLIPSADLNIADNTYCEGEDPGIISGSNPSGGTGVYAYQWQSSPDNISWSDVSGATSASFDPGPVTADIYFRRLEISGPCTGISNVVFIDVTPAILPGAMGPDQVLCLGDTPSALSGPDATGGEGAGTYIYQWQQSPDNASWTDLSNGDANYGSPVDVTSGTITFTTQLPSSTYFRRRVISGECSSYSNSVFIESVATVPPKPVIDIGTANLCAGATNVTYGISSPDALDDANGYTWTYDDGTPVVTTSQSNTINYDFPNSGTVNIYVMASNGCGNGPVSDPYVVIVDDQPVANAGGPTGPDQCDLDADLNAVPSIGTGLWTVASGPGSVTNWGIGQDQPVTTATVDVYGTYNFQWTETNGTCSDSDTVSVSFYEQPTANAGGDVDVCGLLTADLNAIPYSYLALPNVNMGTRGWTLVSGPGNITDWGAGQDQPMTTITVDAYGNSTPYVLRWTEDNGACSDFEEISIYFWEPTVADAGQDIEICGPTRELDADDPAIGMGTWSVISQPGGSTVEFGPGNSEINMFNANVTVDVFGIYEFQWQVVNGSCASADIVQVIFREPAVVTTGGDQFIAAGTATLPLGGSVTGSSSSGTWSVSSAIPGGTFTPDITSLDAIFDPNPAQEADGSVVLRLTSDDPANICPAVWEEITITIGPTPEVQITNPADGAQFCAGETIQLDGLYDGAASEATWSADNGAGRNINTGSFSQAVFNLGTGPQTFTTLYTPSSEDTVAGSVTIYLTSDDPPPAGPPVLAAETSITIYINPIPETSPITGDIAACTSETKIYRVDGVAGSPLSTYSWTIGPLDGNEPSLITGLGNVALLEYGPDPWSGTITVVETSLGCTGTPVTLDVESFALPVADAGPDLTVCNGEPAALGGSPSASGGSGSYTYNWAPAFDIDDPAIANPTVNIANGTQVPLSRIYQLTVIDASTGCISTSDNVTITVNPDPAIANNLNTTICSRQPTGVILDVQSGSVPVDAYTVVSVSPDPLLNVLNVTSPGNGYPADVIANDIFRNTTLNPLQVVYTVIGEGSAGCDTDPKDIVVTINPEPLLDPTLSTAICSGETTDIVLVTLPVSVAALTYTVSVNFQHPDITGVPSTGTGTNTIIMNDVFSNTSSMEQLLIYDVVPTSAIGCDGDVDQIFVSVAPEMTASMDASPQEICAGDATDITFNLTGGGPFDVTYSDGSTDILLAGINDGHQITLSPDTTTIYSLVSVVDNNASGCVPADLSSQVEIKVNPLPSADLLTDTLYLCDGMEADLEIILTGSFPLELTYEDDKGNSYVESLFNEDIILSHYPGTGTTTYSLLSVVDSNTPACIGPVSGSLTAVMDELPTAYISVGGATSGNSMVEICEGESVEITFTLTGIAPWSIDYENNRGDFVTVNDITDPVYRINVNPSETVIYTLARVSDGGMASCEGLLSGRAEIVVHEKPLADFHAEPMAGCAPLDVNLDNYTAGNLSGINTGYYFREQGTSAFSLISHDLFTSYIFENNTSSTIDYEVMFVAETPAGCSDSIVKVLTVDPGLLLDITTDDPLEACSPHTITFNNNNIPSSTLFVWNWGDGESNDTTMYETSVSHTFLNSSTTSSKTYTVTISAINSVSGCEQNMTLPVRINPDINVRITSNINEGCAPLSVNFANSSSGATGHTWFYRARGSGAQEEILTTPYAYYEFTNQSEDTITYEVVYIGRNTYGCEKSDTLEILVWPELDPDFLIDPVQQTLPGSTVTITNNTNPGPWEYYWDFGDGNTSTAPDPVEHVFETYGIYPVALQVTYGPCQGQHTEVATIDPISPIIDFTADIREGCHPLTVNFTNLSQFANPDTYYWTFGDGRGYSVEEHPTYTYHYPGTYTVTLEATNDLGIIVKEIKEFYIEVWESPVAQFNVRPRLVYVPDEPVYTSNLSIGGVEWYWDFGDGFGTSSEYEPTYTYTYPGVYDITLWVTNEYGCKDSLLFEKAVRAEEAGLVATPNVFTPNPDGPGGSGGGIGNPAFNDVFLPIEKGAIEFHLQIFNRWGEILFESFDKNKGWDGYYRGKLSPTDVYVYKLDLKLNDGSRVTRLGDVLLLR